MLIVVAAGSAEAAPVGVAVGNQSYAAYTSNGTTWAEDPDQSIFTPTRTLNGVVAVNATTAWAVGNNESSQGLILRTTDLNVANPTWSRQTGGTIANVNLNDVDFVDTSNGWAVGGSGWIVRTTNGGTTWSSSQHDNNALNSVFFLDSLTGWAVGNAEKVFRTVDGGTVWSDVSTSLSGSPNFFDVFFVSSSTGYIVGADGHILKSTTGGVSWTDESPNSFSLNLNAVHFVNSSTGWVGGNNGKVLQTVDGGTTWTEIFDLGPDAVTDIYFSDLTTGWATSGRRVYGTTNGGASWSEQFFGDHDLNALSFQPLQEVAVPEPSSLAQLLGFLAILLGGHRFLGWRRRNTAL